MALDYNSHEPKPWTDSLSAKVVRAIMNFFGLGAFIGF
jgi:hypothetical protein